jgi:hypothetical protein
MRPRHLLIPFLGVMFTMGVSLFYPTANAAPPTPAANGHGTLFDGTAPNGHPYRRQFSFSARTRSDGTVTGHAVLHNPAFEGANGNQPYMLQVDISCMKVIGNIAFFGGTTRRTTDPNLVDAVFFSIQDNGNPGAGNDRLSRAFFWDDDPTTTGPPEACQNNLVGDFPMETIEAGNIHLK